ncbi:TlpA family protein disulfide reductase [Halorientalis pallida]|uniref:Thioredoxin n=1 Tax=Halorientalis pallida TaxID=2479928 RepID=A0A498L7Y0_9EURY|nr:thioredoxin [Halorientalis pallida]RXK51273.1 thioredoxin [Halorientalis pallida]
MSDGRLTTMEPDPVWDEDSYEETVETLRGLDESVVFNVWGGDWCKDCRSQLPAFGAALEAADVSADRIEHYPTEKEDDGSKTGPGVDEYGIEYIPTVVVEDTETGEELARFVEDAEVPIAVALADDLADIETAA